MPPVPPVMSFSQALRLAAPFPLRRFEALWLGLGLGSGCLGAFPDAAYRRYRSSISLLE